MALAANALTTYETARIELGAPDDDKNKAIVERIINAVSDRIAAEAGGRIFQRSTGIVEKHPGHSDYRLALGRAPIIGSITSIILLQFDGTSLSTFDADSFEIESVADGILFRMAGWPDTQRPGRSIRGNLLPGTERKSVQITYDGGYVTPEQARNDALLTRDLPFDLEEACLIGVASLYRGRGQNLKVNNEQTSDAATSWRDPGVRGTPPSIIPREVIQIARSYMRYVNHG